MLTEYNGTSITYDEIGNPNNWHNVASFVWNKRELSSLVLNDESTLSFAYNSNGIRTQKQYSSSTKTVNHTYNLDGNKIIKEVVSSFSATATSTDTLYYLYDASGSIQGFIYNNDYYYFQKNLQGDIIRILDQTGNVVTEYTYDAWGNILSITGTLADTIGQLNPFRYRGYYYDNETGFYYLQSRYYDPSVGRFLNADGIIGANGGILGYNMFAYCNNNPVVYGDPSGYGFFGDIGNWFEDRWDDAKNAYETVRDFTTNIFGRAGYNSAEREFTVYDNFLARLTYGESYTQEISGDDDKPIVFFSQGVFEPSGIWDCKAGVHVNIGSGGCELAFGLGYVNSKIDLGWVGFETEAGIQNSYGIAFDTDFKNKSAGFHIMQTTKPTGMLVLLGLMCPSLLPLVPALA